MTLLSVSADTLLLGATICLTAFSRRRSTPSSTKNMRQPKYRSLITGILALHTLYMMYTLSFRKPPNLFTSLNFPLTMPSQKIRTVLLGRRGMREEDTLPEDLEDLLMKLNSFDLRGYFVRFGQNTVQECEWCATFTDYVAYALPVIVLSYIKEAALLGVLTVAGTNREAWRSAIIGFLMLACIVDVYWMLTVRVAINQRDPTMWYDTLWTLRHLLFTALPLIAHFVLPASFIASPLAVVPQTNLALQALHQRIQLLKFTTSVTLRVPEFRETAGSYWETQRTEGKWAREDQAINRLAEKTGTGTKREVASELVSRLKHALEPALGH